MLNHSYNENRKLEIDISSIIKEIIYEPNYLNCSIIDNRNKNDSDISPLQNMLKTTKITDEEIIKYLESYYNIIAKIRKRKDKLKKLQNE